MRHYKFLIVSLLLCLLFFSACSPAIPFSEICTVGLEDVERITVIYSPVEFPKERIFLEETEDVAPVLAWLQEMKLGEPGPRRDDETWDGAASYTFTLVSDGAEFSFTCVAPNWIVIGKQWYPCSEDDYQIARQIEEGNPQIPREVYHWRTDTWEPAE